MFLKHSDQYFSENFSGTIGKRISELAETTFNILMTTAHFLWPISWAMIIALVILFTSHPLSTIILLFWLILYVGITFLFTSHISIKNFLFSKKRSETTGKIVDSVSNIRSIKYYAQEKFEVSQIEQSMEKECDAQRSAMIIGYYSGFFRRCATTSLSIGLVIFLIWGWIKEIITLGDIAMITAIANLVRSYSHSIGGHLSTLFEGIGISNEALTLIQQPISVQDKPNAKNFTLKSGNIIFDKITFTYKKDHPNVFDELNLSIPTKQKIALIGPSGGGKSTLVHLLLRFYDVENGAIKIDDQNIADVTQESLRKQIGIIPQDISLFHRTLMENIRYGDFTASDDQVVAAAKKAYAHDFISSLPDGYQTIVGERGLKLSGGQRQRIAIARAILKDAPILILDEATSALDSESEQAIQESLKEIMKDKTVIAIAHRLSTIAHMDRIIVLDEGKVVEDGTHKALLKDKNGLYSRLWKHQFGGFLKIK